MWEHVVWVIGTVAAIALSRFLLWSAYGHGGHDEDLMERAFQGEIFLAEAISSDGSVGNGLYAPVQFCGCLRGMTVEYMVTCGPLVSGVVCLDCARAEFLNWSLRHRCGIDDGDMHTVVSDEKWE